MTGKQFLEVGKELARGKTEPHWRSATSRAYYAAYHVVKDALEKVGILVPNEPSAHELVARCLNNSNEPTLAEAGSSLRNLRTSRISADYHLTSRNYSKNQAALDVSRASAIINSIDTFSFSHTAIRTMQNYLENG